MPKPWKLLLIGTMLVGLAAPLFAQQVVTLGQATSNNIWPFRNPSARYQTAYTAAELNLPGGGQLIEVRVLECQQSAQYQVVSAGTFNGLRVRLAHTNVDPVVGMTSTFDTNYTGPLDTALGPSNFSPVKNASSYFEFPLTSPWSYNGTQGILLDWSFDSRVGDGFWINSPAGRQRVAHTSGNWQTTTANGVYTNGNWQLQFVFQVGPGLTVVTGPGMAQPVYSTEEGPGGNGFAAAEFEIQSNNLAGAELLQVDIEASGTGNDANSFLEVSLYRDDNNNDVFDFGTDVQIGVATNFLADDGVVNFSVQAGTEQQFGTSDTRLYFIVVRLAGTPSPGETFNFAVSDIVVGANSNKSGVPSSVIDGLIIATPEFEFSDASPVAAATVFLGSSGNVCQVFDIEYLGGPDDKPASVGVTGLGTADEAADLSNVQLWYDADQSGDFDAGLDTLVDTQTYSADNGTVTFNMSSHPNFTALDVRRFFVVYNLGLTADDNETFQCYVSAMGTAAFGGVGVNLPAPSANGTAGLIVSANVLLANMNGPLGAVNVNSNTTGPHGDGVLLADVTVSAAPGAAWTVNSLTFNGTGTGNADGSFSELALYLDDGNNTWDGAAVDTLAATTATGFSSGEVMFTLTDTSFPAGIAKRFFFVGKMNGTAQAGQTFNANLQSIDAVPPAGGAINGVPTIDSTALIIDTAAVTVANAPTQPAEIWHVQGSAAHYVVGHFRLLALNDAVTVNGFTLTTGGTGDWNTDVDAATGVEVYLDDGDGVFDAGADSLLFQGGGGATVNCLFTSPLNMPITTEADLWIRIGLTDVAGLGATATANTYTATIADIADVNATSAVVLGTPAPATAELGAIAFNVSSFSPTSDLPAGGKAITIDGSGFVSPITVTIGGIVCPGTANITGGTQITGLTVPNGGGTSLPIVVTSGKLPPQTLTQTFRYRNISTGSGGSGGSGCAAAGNVPTLPLVAGLLAILAVGVSLRRRRA